MSPPKVEKHNVKDIIDKYGSKIESQIGIAPPKNFGDEGYSSAYSSFKKEMSSELSNYERWCQSLGKLIKIKVSEKDNNEIKRYLDLAHVNAEPWQAIGLALMAFLAVFFSFFFVDFRC